MKINLNRIIQIFIALSTLTYMKGRSVDEFDVVSFQIMILIVIGIGLADKIKYNFSLGYLFIPAILTTALGEFNNIVVFNTVNFSLALLGIWVLSGFDKQHIYSAILWSILANLVVLIFQTIGFSPIIKNIAEPGGIFGNAPRLCMYLAITLPFVYEKNKLLALCISSIGILLGEIYLPAFFLLLCIIKGNNIDRWFSIFIGVLSIIVFHNKIFHSFIIRMPVWKPTIEQIFSSPIHGYGIGIYPHVSPQFIPGNHHADTAMSSLLQFVFSMGCIGMAGLVLFIRELPKKLNDTGIALLFLAILSLVEYPFEVPKLWFIICVIVGIRLGEKEKDIPKYAGCVSEDKARTKFIRVKENIENE